ncbi:MAG: outer membrane protein assembly factor BamD [Nitrospira sp.]|nr:outer membrane protein assembly factor BamD [bacterium]MBL7048681.1 outer membrane protein assembly factor BamD [Nitrospira sp.]
MKRIIQLMFIFIIGLSVTGCSTFNATSLTPDWFSKDEEEKVLGPEGSLEKATQLTKDGYYEEAREVLEKVEAESDSREYSTLAKIRIADTYYDDELYAEAAIEYASFLDIQSYSKYAAYAQYKLAMSYFKRIKTIDVSYHWARLAIQEFEVLRRNYPRNPYMDITESRIKMCRRVLAEYEFYVGKFYFEKGSYAAAIGRFNNMLENYPESKSESEALYYLGMSYDNSGQKFKAIEYFNALVEKFPTNELSVKARELIVSIDSQTPRLIIAE